MMTKKDYNQAAAIARSAKPITDITGDRKELVSADIVRNRVVIDAFIQLFKGDNPRFDADRFRAACQPKSLSGWGDRCPTSSQVRACRGSQSVACKRVRRETKVCAR